MNINKPIQKELAVKLRTKGLSIRKIESKVKVARSTLSGWLKNVKLTDVQKRKLYNDWRTGLVNAREKAILWHNARKKERLQAAKIEAEDTLKNISHNDRNILDLALAFLYLGEGSKKNDDTSLGNSDPLVVKFFLNALRKNYKIPTSKFVCNLYLRADQDPKLLIKYWSDELKLPSKNFKRVNIDRRTIGSATYPDYKGVCVVRCGNVAIQRKLINISRGFCAAICE